ncbi:MAG: DUF402 domain-containing protein [Anaerolineales bacterium]|nr:DUF402 domain-containing protein [Anaerolineales bacterium]MCW5855257.1 DUF402 domain-containing protein [Anaerolineales bacterium]
MTEITVLKQNPAGELLYQWQGKLLSQTSNQVLIEAAFNAESGKLIDIQLNQGDRFLETYYLDRWFNIFEIRDPQDDHLKGWYCNVSAPAVLRPGELVFRDFALDLLVYPDGRQFILDEDEFAALDCAPDERQLALDGLAQLQAEFAARFRKRL